MPFPFLLCHACTHSWKDSFGIFLSSIVKTFLMSSTSSKRDILELEEEEKQGRVTREVAPERRWCSGHELSCHSFRLFLRTEQSKRYIISLWQAGWSSVPVTRIRRGRSPQRMWSTGLWLWTSTAVLSFGLGHVKLFQLRLWLLVFGSYSKLHDSSPVRTFPSVVSRLSRMSWSPHALKLLVIVQYFLYHRCADFLHVPNKKGKS